MDGSSPPSLSVAAPRLAEPQPDLCPALLEAAEHFHLELLVALPWEHAVNT